MTTTERPQLWTEVWKALDSNNPGDVCPALLDTYADLACAAVQGFYGQQHLVDSRQVGSCRETLCPRPAGKHGVCHDHSCGSPVPDTDIVCRFPKGHGGVWHDDGKRCWPIDEVLEPRPNPWFTKPGAEFPLEAAERADRERPSIGHAFPTLEWRQQQLDERAEVGA